MPPTWPRIQLFGSGFGQAASTAKAGMSPAKAARGRRAAPISTADATKAATVLLKPASAALEWPRCCTGVMASSPVLGLRFFPLGSQSIAERFASQSRAGQRGAVAPSRHRPRRRAIQYAAASRLNRAVSGILDPRFRGDDD